MSDPEYLALTYLKLLRPEPVLYVQGGVAGLADYCKDGSGQAALQEQVINRPLEFLPRLNAATESSNLRFSLLDWFSCKRGKECLAYSQPLCKRPAVEALTKTAIPRRPGPLLMQLSAEELWIYNYYETFMLKPGANENNFLKYMRAQAGDDDIHRFMKMAAESYNLLRGITPDRLCVLCYRDVSCKWIELCRQGLAQAEQGVLLQRLVIAQSPTGSFEYCHWALQPLPESILTGFCQPVPKPWLHELQWRLREIGGVQHLFLDQSAILTHPQ
eukprot:g73208.t1